MKIFGLKILKHKTYLALMKAKDIETYTKSLEVLDDEYGKQFLKDDYIKDIKREAEWKLKELGRRLTESVKNNKRAAIMLRNMIRQNKAIEERLYDLGYFK